MKKFIIITAIVLGIVYFGLSYFVTHQNHTNDVPTVQDAPYLVQTISRVYYAKQVTGTAPNITMKGYYYTNRQNWVYTAGNLTFNPTFKAKVTRR